MIYETPRRAALRMFALTALFGPAVAARSLAQGAVQVAVDPTCTLSFNGVGNVQEGLFSFNAPPATGIEKYYEEANIRHLRFMFTLAQLGHADWMVPEAELALREDPGNPGRVDPAWWPKMPEAFRHSQALYVRSLLPMGQHGLAAHLKLDFLNPPDFLCRAPKRPFSWGGEDAARLIVGMIKAVEACVPGAHVEAIGVDNEPNLLASASYPGGANDPEAVKDYFALLKPVAERVHKECPGVLVDAPIVAGGLFFYGPWDNFNHWVKPLLASTGWADRIDVHGYMQHQQGLPLELNGSAFRYRVDLGLLRNYEQVGGLPPRPVVVGEHNNWLGADPQKEDYYRSPVMQAYRAHFWLRDLLTYLNEPDKVSLLSCHYSYWKPPPPMGPEFPFNMFDPDTTKPLPSFDVYRVLADLRGKRVWVEPPSLETLKAVSTIRSQGRGKQLVLVLFNDDVLPRTVEGQLRGLAHAKLRNPFCRRLLLRPATGQLLYTEQAWADLRQPIRLLPYETCALRWDIKGDLAQSSCVDRREYYGDRPLVPIEPGKPAVFHVHVPALGPVRRLVGEVGVELRGEKEKVDRTLMPVLSVDGERFSLPEPRFVTYPQSLNYRTQIDANRLDLIATSLPVRLVRKPGAPAVEVTLPRAASGSYRVVFVRLAAEVVSRSPS